MQSKGHELGADSWCWTAPCSCCCWTCWLSKAMTVDLDAAIRLLRLLTPLSASLAFITVAIGLVTSHWLYSEEKMSNPKFNRTGDPELEYISKFTVSGLWTLCYTNRNSLFSHLRNQAQSIQTHFPDFYTNQSWRDGKALFQHRLFPHRRVQSRSKRFHSFHSM